MTPAREAESQARRALFLQLRGGLIAVALYFAACALVTDAHPAPRKDSTMNTPASPWRPHTEQPTTQVKAIILIQPHGGDPVPLSELHVWVPSEGYWISASSHLKIRHTEFHWREVQPLLETPPPPVAWPRDEEATADLLALVGIDVLPVTVVMWTDGQIRQAEDWASAAHLQAGDQKIEVPPMPEFLSKFAVTRTES